MSVPATANSISGGLFLQGPGGVIAVPLIQRFGRLPVLFWSQFLSAMWVMACALAPGYGSFTAFRALQGFFNTAPQVVGLSVVHDLSVLPQAHLHARISLTEPQILLPRTHPSSESLGLLPPWRPLLGTLPLRLDHPSGGLARRLRHSRRHVRLLLHPRLSHRRRNTLRPQKPSAAPDWHYGQDQTPPRHHGSSSQRPTYSLGHHQGPSNHSDSAPDLLHHSYLRDGAGMLGHWHRLHLV